MVRGRSNVVLLRECEIEDRPFIYGVASSAASCPQAAALRLQPGWSKAATHKARGRGAEIVAMGRNQDVTHPSLLIRRSCVLEPS
jgi:hypothetical protein